MNYRFKTPDHPAALGTRPSHGDVSFTLNFPTDDGGIVFISMGEDGFRKHFRMVQDAMADLAATRERDL
jgi:hypothetical protein